MKSIIKGFNYVRIFRNGVYSSRNVEPIKRICKLPLGMELWHVVKPKRYFGKLYDPKKMRLLEIMCNVSYQDINTRNMGGSGEFPIIVYACHSKIDGGYIGTPEDTYHYIFDLHISQIQKAHSNDNVCSIGFLEKEQKWVGWSHRAMRKFGIGDIVKEGDCFVISGYTNEYIKDHPEGNDRTLPVGFKAKTLKDAKKMAIAFADSVS